MTKIKAFLLALLAPAILFAFSPGSALAQEDTGCYINGEPVPCEEVGEAFASFAGYGIAFGIVMFVVSIVAFVFWILMIVHAATKPIENKALWIVVMVLTGILGAIIYYFVVKRNFTESAPAGPAGTL